MHTVSPGLSQRTVCCLIHAWQGPCIKPSPARARRAERFLTHTLAPVLCLRRFDRLVKTRYPANVLSGFEAAAGATFFNLNDLQDEYKDSPGSVITAGRF